MEFNLSFYLVILAISALIALGLGWYAWKQRAMPAAVPFALLMWDASAWAVANAFEMAGMSLPVKLFWANFQYLCYTSIPLLWLELGLRFTGRERFLKMRRTVLLWIIPAITNLLVWTDPFHHLMRWNVHLDTTGPFPVIAKEYGPWTYVHFAYSYLLMIFVIYLFANALRTGERVFRGQSFILLVGLLFPLAWNILYTTGLSPVKRHDISPAVLSLVGVFITWGLFRFKLFDILPVAHDAVLNSIGDGMIVLNTKMQVSAINPVAQRLFGWPASSVLGRPAAEVFRDWPELAQVSQSQTEAKFEFFLLQAGEDPRYFDLSLSPLFDSFNRPIGQLIILHDITERKQVEEKLLVLSQTDSLTGLNNRRRFYDALEHEIARSRRYELPLSVIMIDVDDMKRINDTYGHQAGDEVLQRLANLIHQMRQSDVAARVGGDEFALLLPSTARDGAEQLAWRLHASGRTILLEKGVPLAISLGIAWLEKADDEQGRSLLARADRAMYLAKQAGLGCVVSNGST